MNVKHLWPCCQQLSLIMSLGGKICLKNVIRSFIDCEKMTDVLKNCCGYEKRHRLIPSHHMIAEEVRYRSPEII